MLWVLTSRPGGDPMSGSPWPLSLPQGAHPDQVSGRDSSSGLGMRQGLRGASCLGLIPRVSRGLRDPSLSPTGCL